MKLAILIAGLLIPAASFASQHAAVISLEGCASVGDAVLMWTIIANDYLNDSVMALGWHTGMLLCDADLPPDATHFDYAELEYTPGILVGPPWLVAYAVRRQTGPTGAQYLWMDEIGSCGGLDPAAYPPWTYFGLTPQLSICQTPGWVDLTDAAAELTGVAFLVVVPVDHYASNDTQPDFFGSQYYSQVYRIVEYYEQ